MSLHHSIGERQRLRVRVAGRDGPLERWEPGLEIQPVERATSHREGERRREEAEAGRRDPVGGEELQEPFGGPDQAAGVAAQVEDEAGVGKDRGRICLGNEGVVVGDVEAQMRR
jgi:hypothetical protein